MLLEGHLFFTNWLIANRNAPLLQVILFQFFYEETIQKFDTLARLKVLADYLRKCCEGILATVSAFHSSLNQNKKSSDLEYAINEVIRDELRNFIFQIIAVRKLPINDFGVVDYNRPWFSEVGYDKGPIEKTDPDYSETFPKSSLMKDKKFMKILKKVNSDFKNGCKDYFIGVE